MFEQAAMAMSKLSRPQRNLSKDYLMSSSLVLNVNNILISSTVIIVVCIASARSNTRY